MKKRNPNFTIIIFSMLVGLLIAIQMKAKVEFYIPATLKSLQITKNEISNINKEISELNKEIKIKEEELLLLKNISKGDAILLIYYLKI